MRRLHIASYNVHRCRGMDGRKDAGRVAEVVAQLGAAVVALQEIECEPEGEEEAQLARVARTVGGTAIAGPTTRARSGVVFGNALLTTLPVRSVRHLDLSCGGREPRGALDVDLDAYGVRLRVIATHLGLSPWERREQVRKLLEVTSHDDEGVTVLLGDINEWFVAGRPLRWLHARFGRGPHVRSWPSPWPVFALDRVWVHPSRDLVHLGVVTTAESRRASDHLPVIAEIEVAGPRHGGG